jgi:FkbM family methyltransferase
VKIAQLSAWATPYCTEHDLRLAFGELGWDHVALQERRLDLKALAHVETDLVLYTRLRGLPAEATRVWRHLEERGIPVAGFHLDRFWGLEREKLIPHDPFFTLSRLFTADGGNQDRWAEAGVAHTWCPPAAATRSIVRGTPRPEFEADVTFIGGRSRYWAEWLWRCQLLDAVADRYGGRFLHLGPEVGCSVRQEDLADAIASAKVILGDSFMTSSPYWSDRVPETMARHGALVHPLLPPESGFVGGRDYAPYEIGDEQSVFAAIDGLLDNDEARAEMAWHGNYEVRRAHTYADRIRGVLLPALAEDWSHLRNPETVLRMLARPDTTDADVIDEVWRADIYRLNGVRLSGAHVIDIGANIGAFTLRAAALGATVIAMEPEPGNRAVLERALAMSGLAPRVTVIAGAVGPENGLGSTQGTGGGVRAVADEHGTFPIYTLDELLPDQVDLLKIDAEGAEFDSFAAAKRLEVVGRIAMETHESAEGPRLGELVRHLLRTHSVEVSGQPGGTGMLYATRYGVG